MTHLLLAAMLAVAPTDTVRGVVADSLAEYVGWYRWGFERSEFVACEVPAGDRPWWVVPTDAAIQQRDSLAAVVTPDAAGPVFVRVRGIAGQRLPNGAGHLGGSARYFRLLEVLDMKREVKRGVMRGMGVPQCPTNA
jgi:hypothetical protein